MTKKYKPISFSDFVQIREGYHVYCLIDNEIRRERVVQGAFYNADADSPEWEIETENGFFCWDSVYIEDIPLQAFTDDPEKMRDFYLLSKDEFLQSYSYLTEEEYELTREATRGSLGGIPRTVRKKVQR